MSAPGLGRAGPLRRRRRRGFGGPAVTALKLVLVLAALGYVALVFSWQRLTAPAERPVAARDPGPATDRPVIQVDLVNTRLLGRRGDIAYRVIARTAQRAGPAGDLVALEAPRAVLDRDNGDWARFTARRGVYDRRARSLRLDGDVTGLTSHGHELAAESLTIDLAAATVSSPGPVRGSWPGGVFRASDGGQVGFDGSSAALFGASRVVWTGRAAPPVPLPKPPPPPLPEPPAGT